VITQFASHEYTSLSWAENNSLEGDSHALSRIMSFLFLAMYFNATIMAISYAGIVALIGFPSFLYVFFQKKNMA